MQNSRGENVDAVEIIPSELVDKKYKYKHVDKEYCT